MTDEPKPAPEPEKLQEPVKPQEPQIIVINEKDGITEFFAKSAFVGLGLMAVVAGHHEAKEDAATVPSIDFAAQFGYRTWAGVPKLIHGSWEGIKSIYEDVVRGPSLPDGPQHMRLYIVPGDLVPEDEMEPKDVPDGKTNVLNVPDVLEMG